MSRSAYILSAVVFCSLPVIAAAPLRQDPASDPPEAMPSHEEMMQQWMMMNQPGEHHEHIKAYEGDWKADIKMWQEPGAEVQESTGTQVNRLILNGRFLTSDFKGEFFGMEFAGFGMLGYDNMQKSYTNIWTDNMSTNVMISNGSCRNGGKLFECVGELLMPGMEEASTFRQVWRLKNKDSYTYESYARMPGMDEYRNMLITYTRQKKTTAENEGLIGAGASPKR